MTVLGTLGGQIVAILGISRFFLFNFQKFSYDKSALKQLYHQEVNEQVEEQPNSALVDHERQRRDTKYSWKENLRARFRNRKEMMHLRYCTYLCLPILSCLCCCLMRRYESDQNNWYSRRRLALAKFEIAREKLKSEVDMKEIIMINRVSKFLHRMQTSRRQRASV